MSKPAPPLSPSDRLRDRRCSVCNTLLTVHRIHRGICDAKTCRDTYFRKRLREDRIHLEEELRELAATQRTVAMAATRSTGAPEDYPAVIVPFNDRPLQEVPACRRQALRKHLAGVIALALEKAKEAPPEQAAAETTLPEDQQRLSSSICAVCRGVCCHRGGDEAYLDATTLHPYVSEHRDDTLDELVELYMSFVPDMAYADSCIYHTRNGCALPRDLRGSTCRHHFCDGLLAFQKGFTSPTPHRSFVAARDSDGVLRFAVIDEDGIRDAGRAAGQDPV